jgi:tryptophan synthase beta chain
MAADAAQAGRETVLVVNLSGRGDKDMEQAQKLLDPGRST